MNTQSVIIKSATLLLCSLPLHAHAQYIGPAASSAGVENTPVVPTTDPNILHPTTHDFLLAQGDLLSVRVFAVPDFNQSVRVMPDGSLTLPLIGTVHIGGLNIQQAEQLIAKKLIDDGMVRDPQVSISVIEAPNLITTVTGEVHMPGLVPVIGQRTLADVLAASGGINPIGSHVVTIIRPGVEGAITVDLGSDPSHSARADIPIFAGDHIIVARTGVIYTFGAFHLQSAFPLSNSTPLTLLQACALAGGVPFEAQRNGTRIIRTVGNQRTQIKVDLGKVISGKVPDPVLQPDDIVFIPTNAMRAAIRAGGLSTVLTALYAVQLAP